MALLASGGRDCHTLKPVVAALAPHLTSWGRRRLRRLLLLITVPDASLDCLERGAPVGLQPDDAGLLRFWAVARLRFL
jgi:hypothetical protein